MNLGHFVHHMSEVQVYRGEEGYSGRRLVSFGGGGVHSGGACGYAHAVELYLAPGDRILSHWHTDREAIFYCLSGHGRFLLDDLAREVGPGDAMFQPLGALHGMENTGGADWRFLDAALFTDRPSTVGVGERCFANVGEARPVADRGATLRALFPASTFGNPKIEWCGDLAIDGGGGWETHTYPASEQILLVLAGEGTLTLEDATAPVREGSVVYVPAGFAHGIAARTAMRLWGVRAADGRLPTPPLLRRPRGGA